MISKSRSLSVLLLCMCCVTALAQKPAVRKPVPAKAPAKPAAAPKAEAAPSGKSALDKPTLEAYVRHLFVWGPQFKVRIDDPKPAPDLPGFHDVKVNVTMGEQTEQVPFLVSRDGRKILRAMVFDINQNPFKPELDKLKTELQPSFGTPGAPVVIVLFSDFQCPYCKDESQMLRRDVLSAYPKQVRVYFMDYPLSQIHPWAKMAAIAGRCVFRQNAAAFWDYHDWMFEHQKEITAENLTSKVMEFAKTKEIDTLQLSRCLESRATEAEVDKSLAQGKDLQVMSTPTMFVNGRRIATQVAWPQLRNIIDYEIEYQKTAKNAGEDCGCELKLPSALAN